MKKILLILVLSLFSCENDDDENLNSCLKDRKEIIHYYEREIQFLETRIPLDHNNEWMIRRIEMLKSDRDGVLSRLSC